MISEELKMEGLKYQAPRLIDIPGHINDTGSVHFWENIQLFPQGILRCFWISGVKEGESRGNHAHKRESQVLIAIAGKLEVKVSGVDGSKRVFVLDKPNRGLFVPIFNWIEIYFSSDAVLLGLGDQYFSEDEYIRDKSDFENLR
ncbi:sugar 3,4-ketoisomerase [Algoriphagus sp.]|uniref:sugar 3,4-ketoisomerase n=1 Tax=Algoriphagus sp. TaxID=1872435 RepID=UPI0039189882